ncbi:MAG TPA: virulence-associated E family protein [Roseiarcus sp.]|jgi:predicted P-loop ATPase
MADPPDEGIDGFLPEEPPSNVTPFDPKRRRKPKPPPAGGIAPWYDTLRKDNGRVIPDVANVLHALSQDQALVFAMAFDEMRQRSMAMAEWPHTPRCIPPAFKPHEIGEDDVTILQEWLQWMGMPRVGREIVAQACERFARERRIHPVRDWLEALESDGGNLRQNWLTVCLGVEDNPYHQAIGKMFLTAMVARIFEPGCKCDYMIVLEGPQGELKSQFCRILAGGDEYFSEHLPRIDGDQVRLSMHLRGKWLIEVSELAAFLKADPEAMKHFVSQQVERYIPKYGRSEVTEPRQCVFIGTTNEDEYIRDVTGGRRYWPIKCREIRLDRLEGMRRQLFAEAVAAYRANEAWWPDRTFEKDTIAPVQEARQWEDALAEKVREIIDPLSEITLAQLGARIGFDNTRFDMLAQKRVSSILRKANWRNVRWRGGGKIWRKPE